jgi:hypothetical protein
VDRFLQPENLDADKYKEDLVVANVRATRPPLACTVPNYPWTRACMAHNL